MGALAGLGDTTEVMRHQGVIEACRVPRGAVESAIAAESDALRILLRRYYGDGARTGPRWPVRDHRRRWPRHRRHDDGGSAPSPATRRSTRRRRRSGRVGQRPEATHRRSGRRPMPPRAGAVQRGERGIPPVRPAVRPIRARCTAPARRVGVSSSADVGANVEQFREEGEVQRCAQEPDARRAARAALVADDALDRLHVAESPELEALLDVDELLAQVVRRPLSWPAQRRLSRTRRLIPQLRWCGTRPVALDAGGRNRIAPPREIAQELVVEARRLQHRSELRPGRPGRARTPPACRRSCCRAGTRRADTAATGSQRRDRAPRGTRRTRSASASPAPPTARTAAAGSA